MNGQLAMWLNYARNLQILFSAKSNFNESAKFVAHQTFALYGTQCTLKTATRSSLLISNNAHVQKKQERDYRKQQHSDKRKREIDRKILEAIKVSQRVCTECAHQHYLLHLFAYFGSLAKLLA